MPPPTTLPKVDRSGVMPYKPCAEPGPTRKPVITSSKISTAPCCVHSSRMAARNSGLGAIRFMLPATGSTITQAMAWPCVANASRQALRIVVVEHQGVLRQIGRHAGRRGIAEGQQARAGLHQQAVAVAVVAALELDDRIAPGKAARQADRAHGGLGAGGHQAHHVHARHALHQQLGQFDLALGRCAEGKPFRRRFLHRAHRVRHRHGRGSAAPRSRRSRYRPCRRHPTPGRLRRARKTRGVPPTERNARTGELTPPGMVFWARRKRSSLRVMRESWLSRMS